MTSFGPKAKVLGLAGLALVLALASTAALSSCKPTVATPPQETAMPQAGDPAPAATYTLAGNGQSITLPEANAGKPYALLFFSYG